MTSLPMTQTRGRRRAIINMVISLDNLLDGLEHTLYLYNHGPDAVKGIPEGQRIAIHFRYEPDPNAAILGEIVDDEEPFDWD